MSKLHDMKYPGESDEYRAARNELLRAELELREKVASVAALRQKLPDGGTVKEDYEFREATDGSPVRLSELFTEGKDTLILYSFMYGPDAENPCPMCTSFLDTANATTRHVLQRANFAIVAKAPPEKLKAWMAERGWDRLRGLSSHGTTYNADYFAEMPDGGQLPACNVFRKGSEGIRHFWAAEALYAKVDGHPRHMDMMWPVWSFLDITPEGRGDWLPGLGY